MNRTHQATRRAFLIGTCATTLLGLTGLTGCNRISSDPDDKVTEDGTTSGDDEPLTLPDACPDPQSPFAVDERINVHTIDDYLNAKNVVFRDMRLIKDPAAYEDIGGSADLNTTIEGFKIVPFPYVGTLAPLPVSGAYDGERLYDIEWGEGIEILAATARFDQSEQILEELFPKDKDIVLMCGGGGYAGMMRSLLIYLGWNPDRIYNLGGMWDYEGDHVIELIYYDDDGNPCYYLWRADIAPIEFDQLNAVSS